MTKHSVLIVEDDETLRRGLSDNFRSDGYDVRTASDGKTALETALSDSTDLILLDIMLPKMNGYEICRRLRECDVESTIIMLTAKGQEDDIIRGLELGADDYVTKPFSIRELLARSRAFLRRKEEPPRAVIEFGECRLDLTAHKLFRQDAEVTLTSKEFQLLQYMATRPGRALSRREILDGVWGSSVIVTTRSVDRCVTTLRSKIEPNPKKPSSIKTIRDIGYRFEPD
jgi:DNA-binding response OmpR family regulator